MARTPNGDWVFDDRDIHVDRHGPDGRRPTTTAFDDDDHAPVTRGYPEFDPDQPRDEHGRWGGGGVATTESEAEKDRLQTHLIDYKPDRSLTGPDSSAITDLIPGGQRIEYLDVPGVDEMHRRMGLEPTLDTDPDVYAKTRDTLFRAQPVRRVPFSRLVYTQDRVNLTRAREIANTPTQFDLPVYVIQTRDHDYVMNGHHRVAAAFLAERGDIVAHVLDLRHVDEKAYRSPRSDQAIILAWIAAIDAKGLAMPIDTAPHRPVVKFDSDQPRVPAGNPDGGQWTSGGGGGGGSTFRSPEEYVQHGVPLDRHARSVLSTTSVETFREELDRDPAIIQARNTLANGVSTRSLHVDENGQYTPERSAKHQQVVDDLIAKGGGATKPGETPRLVMLLGPPGSGKSTAVGPLIGDEKNFTVMNVDEIRKHIPEYQPQAAGLTQDEVSDIERMLVPRIMAERHHTVMDWTGRSAQKVLDTARMFKTAGYRVEMYEVHVPDLEAAKRAYVRFRYGNEKRFVDPNYVLDVDAHPFRSYETVRDSGYVDVWASYDNDVPIGTKPKLIEKGGHK